jgi:hypothetical protein
MKRTIGELLDDASRRIGTLRFASQGAHKVPLSNTTVSGLPLNFRKFKSVQKHGLYAVPTFVPAQPDFQLVLLTKIAFGVGKILIDKRR